MKAAKPVVGRATPPTFYALGARASTADNSAATFSVAVCQRTGGSVRSDWTTSSSITPPPSSATRRARASDDVQVQERQVIGVRTRQVVPLVDQQPAAGFGLGQAESRIAVFERRLLAVGERVKGSEAAELSPHRADFLVRNADRRVSARAFRIDIRSANNGGPRSWRPPGRGARRRFRPGRRRPVPRPSFERS